MNFLSEKALIIGVGIMISLSLTSIILVTLNQMTLLYQNVYKTDISIKNEFVEFSMDEKPVVTGLDMYNTAKKYKNNAGVIVKSGTVVINKQSWVDLYNNSTDRNYTSRIYDVTYSTDSNKIVTILFKGR